MAGVVKDLPLSRYGDLPFGGKQAVLVWQTTGASNGPTEGLNSIIKNIKRVAAGFTNFAHYRTRIPLAIGGCNWNLIALQPR